MQRQSLKVFAVMDSENHYFGIYARICMFHANDIQEQMIFFLLKY